MALRIRTNIASLSAQNDLSQSTELLTKTQERLSSGFRINRASDDAAGLAVSENMRAKIRSQSQARRNALDGISVVQVAESSMAEMNNILIRLRELAVQSASDTISDRDRSMANREYSQLVEEIDRIGNTTEFNGVKLLRSGGEDQPMEQLTIHVGVGSGKHPNHDTIQLDLKNLEIHAAKTLKLSAEDGIGPQKISDGFFGRQPAADKITILDNALDRINSVRADLGSKQSRLSVSIQNLSVADENLSAAKSRIKDTDFAKESASYTQHRILQQSGASILSQANALPELAISLLR